MPRVNAYKDRVVTRLWKGLQGLVRSHGIDFVEGEGRLVSPTQVQVGDTVYEGTHVVLATGSQAKSLPGLELDGERVITSDEALMLERVPQSVVILGGGVIGAEFASVWRSFGAEVTIVEMLPHLAADRGGSSSKLLERAFRRRGISYELGARFESVKSSGNGVTVSLEGGKTIDAELLLVAVGPRSRLRRARLRRGRAWSSSAASSRSTRSAGPTSRRSPRSAISSLPRNSRMSASPKGSWSPSGLAGSTLRRSTTTAYRASPTASRKWPRWALPPPWRRTAGHRGRGIHLRPGGQRQEPDPADAGRGEGHRDGRRRPRRRRASRRQPGRRTDRARVS